jgi:ribonuclease BN (tRNA processing enzyme)
MSRLVFLGTGSALPTAERGNTALAVSDPAGKRWLLIDCGGDPYRAQLRAGIGPDAVQDLLITHAHIDHIGGLPSLIESYRIGGRTAPLAIWALPEPLAVARRLLDLYSYELTLYRWPFSITVNEIQPFSHLTLAGISLRTAPMDHALPSVGMRMDLPLGQVCYTCDTQPNAHLPELARNASLLITECTFLHRQVEVARITKHLTAREAGQEAKESGAGALALVHIGGAETGDGKWAAEDAHAEAASMYGGRVFIPDDGDAIEV